MGTWSWYRIGEETSSWVGSQWTESYHPAAEDGQWKTREAYRWVEAISWGIKEQCRQILQRSEQDFHNSGSSKVGVGLHLHGRAPRIGSLAPIYKRASLSIDVVDTVVASWQSKICIICMQSPTDFRWDWVCVPHWKSSSLPFKELQLPHHPLRWPENLLRQGFNIWSAMACKNLPTDWLDYPFQKSRK